MVETPPLAAALLEVVRRASSAQIDMVTLYLHEHSEQFQSELNGDPLKFDLFLQLFEDVQSGTPPSEEPSSPPSPSSSFAGKKSDNPRDRKKRREDNSDAAFSKFLETLRGSVGDHVAENVVWPALSYPIQALAPLRLPTASLEELNAALQIAKQVIQFRHVATPAEAYYTGGVVYLYASRKSAKHVTMRSEAFVQACEEIGLHTRTVWSRVSFYRLASEFPRLLCWGSFSLNVFLKHQTRLRVYLRCLSNEAELEFWKTEAQPEEEEEPREEENALMASPQSFPALDQQFLDSLLSAQAVHEPAIFFD